MIANDQKTRDAEKARWDLSILYSGIDDPKLEADLSAFEAGAKAFQTAYRGALAARLGAALQAQMELGIIAERLTAYLYMLTTTDLSNEKAKTKMNAAERRLAAASGEYLQFFELELNGLDDAAVATLIVSDPVCAKHAPLIRQIRRFKPHQLSEPVEAALAKRAPFSAGTWGEFHDEVEAELRIEFEGAEKTLTEMIDIMSNDRDGERRAAAMAKVDGALSGPFAKYAARALSVECGAKAVEDRERKYPAAISERNLANQIPDEVVSALHATVTDDGGKLARRYYSLKARLLGRAKLRWSDRNAPLPYADNALVPYAEAVKIVTDGYRSFSPTLSAAVEKVIAMNWIDAPQTAGKRSGAFNYSVAVGPDKFATFVMLNYLGTHRDVQTLAHELGHAAHGLLAGAAQGPLMFRAPTAYAETASVFGEEIVFRSILAGLDSDPRTKLAYICAKIDESMNTVVRQIGFSNFEKKLHAAGAQLSADEIGALWLGSLRELYGADGEIFTYEHAGNLWSYVSHFHRPFYCYGYAFGQLLTQSLYAAKDRLGEKFEALYVDLLAAGGTKNASELLKPFGLDPARPDFWKNGLDAGVGALIAEAEELEKICDKDQILRV
jgi:oligoendopeptidase F